MVQASTDLVILTALLHFSGGIRNPFAMLMLLHVVIAGIILSRRRCLAVATLASGLFALLAVAEWAGIVAGTSAAPLHLVSRVIVQSAMFFLTAFLVTTVTERLRKDDLILARLATRALADQQLLERSLETTGTGLRVLDDSLRTAWTSPLWERWFVARDRGVGERIEAVDTAAGLTLRDGALRVTQVHLPRDDATDSPRGGAARSIIQVSTAPLFDGQRRITQVAQLAQDVTVQVETQGRMVRAEQLAAVGRLAGQVAHEINNPVAIMSAKSRLLLSNRRGEMSAKTAVELEKIVDLMDRVAGVAQGLLSASRPVATARVPVDIRVPIRRALATIEERARAAGCRIEVDLADPISGLRGNPGELEQIFVNLFLNALDAMPEGGVLTVLASDVEDPPGAASRIVEVVVTDTGIGIAPETLPHIFEPFFTTKEEGRGTGLGLSICHRLTRSHGGELDVESDIGRGARFRLRLPVEQDDMGAASDHA
jgi:signal transduction histidine kinase